MKCLDRSGRRRLKSGSLHRQRRRTPGQLVDELAGPPGGDGVPFALELPRSGDCTLARFVPVSEHWDRGFDGVC
jgi:hypothetical protein